ncbi:MAG: SAM-dependent methyltransferase [Pseudonocardiaceae bacterium]|nr:SAM-dependent methyltransferase [Pseudonocardiaceae bacterium]
MQELPAGVALTAIAMAQERRLETERTDGLVHDTLAEIFVDQALASTAGTALSWMNDGLSLGDFCPAMGDFVALRTRYMDDRLLALVRRAAVRQVVIPAAGLDCRAYRLPWPAEADVFEIDFPAVIEFKQRALATADQVPSSRRTAIPADLRGDWTEALLHGGFDIHQPAIWVIEGLLMYLSGADAERLLHNVNAVAAPGSHLMADHAYPAALRNAAFALGRQTLDGNGSAFRTTIADPVGWLDGHGWSAGVAKPADLVSEHDRELPPVLDPRRPDAPIFWLATATKR